MDPNPEGDTPLLGQPGIALNHAVLHFGGTADGVDRTPEFDKNTVPGAFDHPAPMHGNCRVDQIASQRSKPSQGALFVRSGQSAISDDIGGQDRGQFADLAHSAFLSEHGFRG
jgi:hypothetical protein